MEQNHGQPKYLCTNSHYRRRAMVPLLMKAEDNLAVRIVQRDERDDQIGESCQIEHGEVGVTFEPILGKHDFQAQIEAEKSDQAREDR